MGACLSGERQDGDVYFQEARCPLFFHPYVKGQRIWMDETHCYARRMSTFHDAIVFTNRPLQVQEVLSLRVIQVEGPWVGGLRVGFTCCDPSEIDPLSLPPFLCPDLSTWSGFWAAALPDWCGAKGTWIQLWFDKSGRVLYSINKELTAHVLVEGIPACSPLWAVVDVYGTTKAVQLLDSFQTIHESKKIRAGSSFCSLAPAPTVPTLPAFHRLYPKGQLEECTVCFSSKVNAVISPCGHACVCYSCAQQVFQTSAKCPMCRQRMQDILLNSPNHDGTGRNLDTSGE